MPTIGRAEGHGIRCSKLAKGVAPSSEHRLLGRQIPDLHPPIGAGRREVPTVGMEDDAARRLVVRLKLLNDLPRPDVPDSDNSVSACGSNSFSVGTERDAV